MKDTLSKLSNEEILHNAIRFSFDKAPRKDGGITAEDFQGYKKTFINCVKWLRDNYEPSDSKENAIQEVEAMINNSNTKEWKTQ